MHILTISERQELIDMYTGKESPWLSIESRPAYIFEKALHYLVVNRIVNKKTVDKARKLIDALADWTHNPTESELRKILDDVDVEREFYKISFKDITISQCDAIVKAGNMKTD